jgi:hypothetical protein
VPAHCPSTADRIAERRWAGVRSVDGVVGLTSVDTAMRC